MILSIYEIKIKKQMNKQNKQIHREQTGGYLTAVWWGSQTNRWGRLRVMNVQLQNKGAKDMERYSVRDRVNNYAIPLYDDCN